MATAVMEVAAATAEYLRVPIDQVAPAPGFNNRRALGDLAELAASIKSLGLLQPLLVRKVESALDRDVLGYFIIAGHRRHAASKLAGLTHVDVKVVDQDEKARMESLLVENLHRLDIDPLEEADGYQRLVALDVKQKEIAAKVGRSEAHVSKRLALLRLPAEVHQLVIGGKLTIADALEFTPHVDQPEIIALTLKAVNESIRNHWGFRVSDHARGAARRVEEDRKHKAAIERLTAAKVRVLKHDNDYSAPRNTTVLGKGYAQLPISVTEHAKDPCHAAYVRAGEIVNVCTLLDNHKGSTDKAVTKAIADIRRSRSYDSPSRGDGKVAKEQAKKAAASRERNKVLRIREPLRVAELKRLLTAKQKREDIVDFALRQLLQRFLDESQDVEVLAAQLLEVPHQPTKHAYERAKIDWPTWLAGGKDRLLLLAYAIGLVSGEFPFQKLLKQGYFDGEYVTAAGRYMAHLQANGYKPDKFELAQLGKPDNAYQWRAPFDAAPAKAKK